MGLLRTSLIGWIFRETVPTAVTNGKALAPATASAVGPSRRNLRSTTLFDRGSARGAILSCTSPGLSSGMSGRSGGRPSWRPDAQSKFLTNVVANVDSSLANGRFCTPLPVDLKPVDCPGSNSAA